MIKESGFLASLVIHGKDRATVTYITRSICHKVGRWTVYQHRGSGSKGRGPDLLFTITRYPVAQENSSEISLGIFQKKLKILGWGWYVHICVLCRSIFNTAVASSFISFLLCFLCSICLCVCMWVCISMLWHTGSSKVTWQESVVSFHHMTSRCWAQVSPFGGKLLPPCAITWAPWQPFQCNCFKMSDPVVWWF